MRQATLLTSVIAAALPMTATAQNVDLIEEGGLARDRAPNVSSEFLDPDGRTRFHFISRFTFSDGDEAFTDSSISSFEAKAVIRIVEGLALSFVVPAGLEAPKPGSDEVFLGNVRAGVAGGASIWLSPPRPADPTAPRLGLGGGFDLYIPTARRYENGDCRELGQRLFCNPVRAVRNTRSYEQELYLERTVAFRARGHVEFSVSIITAELELGLTPAITTVDSAEFLMLFFWGLRLAVRPIDPIEPYIEVGSSIRATGEWLDDDDLDTPVRLTVGVRGHFVLDPALFVSFDLADGGVLFGIDLAAAIRTESRDKEDDPFRGF